MRLIVFAIVCVLSTNAVLSQTNQFRHDYSQSLVMKILISVLDGEGGTKVYCDLNKTLDLIERTENLNPGAPKIHYLWYDEQIYPSYGAG